MFFSLTLQIYAAIEDVIQYPTKFQKSYKFLAATSIKGKVHNVVTVGRVYNTSVTGDQYAYVTSIMGFNKSGKYVYFAHTARIKHIFYCFITTPPVEFLQRPSCLNMTRPR